MSALTHQNYYARSPPPLPPPPQFEEIRDATVAVAVCGHPRCHSGNVSLWRSTTPRWQCQFVEIHEPTIAVLVCGDPRPRNGKCQFVEIHDPTMAVSVYGDPRHHGGSVRLWRSTTPQLQCQYVDVHDTTVAMSVREDPRRHSGRVSSCVAAGDGRSTRGRNTCLPIGSHTLSAANNQVWACQWTGILNLLVTPVCLTRPPPHTPPIPPPPPSPSSHRL